MNILQTTVIFVSVLLACDSHKKISTFWHISDILWQNNISDNCTRYVDQCIKRSLDTLLQKSGKLYPDFILWSSAGGRFMNKVVIQMRNVLKGTVVLPCLPPIKLPATRTYTHYYQKMSDKFGDWLDDISYATFWKTGYYTKALTIPRDLQIIVLNTAFFCNFHIASELDDPADQWTWLTSELMKARHHGKKVYLLLSATPGVASTYESKMFAFKHNRHYIAMVRRFSDVIKAQFGGFEDGDKFHIFYNKEGHICGWVMLEPPFCRSARLYLYDLDTSEPIDYFQFYNKEENWHIEYRFSDHYSVPNMSAFAFERIVKRMEENDDMFAKYITAVHRKQFSPHRIQPIVSHTLKLPLGENPLTLASCGPAKHCYASCICNVKAVDFRDYTECVIRTKKFLFRSEMNNGVNLSLSIILIYCVLIINLCDL